MDVSHFELIWKPQSPATPIGQTGIDNVFQGYFLKITNLEPVAYSYAIEFVAAPAAVAERSLAGNAVVFIDTPGSNNTAGTLNGTITSTIFTPTTGRITIPPNGTALVALLPSAFANLPLDPTPLVGKTFEVRGHVRLRLPPVFRQVQTPLGPRFIFTEQANAPVRVMLTPQHRATYYAADGTLSDQTQSSLPTASGAAVSLLPPDPALIVANPPIALDAARLERITALIADEDRSSVLAALMTALDSDKANLAGVNAMLAEAGIQMALERRKPRASVTPVPAE